MRYLLDVNALIALGLINHQFHERVACWARAQQPLDLATCSITELGFVRILAQAPAYGFTVTQARTLLLRLKEENTSRLVFITDDRDVSDLPTWVRSPKQIADGHLINLAKAKGGNLATLDERIPGAYFIPNS